MREFALFGDTTGETDEFGLPVRYPWAEDYRGKAMVVAISRRVCVALYEEIIKLRPGWHGDTDDTGRIKVVMLEECLARLTFDTSEPSVFRDIQHAICRNALC